MAEPLELQWPLEAHPRQDPALAFRIKESERVLAPLKDAEWRSDSINAAVKILEEATIPGFDQQKPDLDSVAEVLGRVVPESAKSSDVAVNQVLVDSVIGEAVGWLLVREPNRDSWTLATGLWSHFPGMLAALGVVLKDAYENDTEFRADFDDLANAVFDQAATGGSTEAAPSKSDLGQLADRWRAAPNLREVWSGLHWMRHEFGPSEARILAHIYLKLNAPVLAGLLDRFDNPYQIWDILTGWANLGLDRNFSSWAAMLRWAEPAFGEDGSWTGRTLEPLLLQIAEEALKQARLPRATPEDLVKERGLEFDNLTKGIAEIIGQKSEGGPLALRWGAQLFRYSSQGTDAEPYPRDLRDAATPLWRMLEALGRSDAAAAWNDIAIPDAVPEDALCLLAAKTVAADERRSQLPDMKPLLDCCPDGPESFLGFDAIGKRMETMPFLTQNTRPDALRFRVFALLFFQGNPVDLYRKLWKRTLTLRELAEHWHSGEQNDGRTDAQRVLAMILAIGMNLLDLYADVRSASTGAFPRSTEEFGLLFKAVYDSLREVQAIEVFHQPFWSILFTHLLVRRVIYEKPQIGDLVLEAPLSPTAQPMLSEMLADIAGLKLPFFQALENLLRNGVSADRIAMELKSRGVDLATWIDAAKLLNAIDERRPYRIETLQSIL
ncbi:hypothetical protein [Bradyrhizobium sp. BR13661]|jgi:hypothetical protein|uniref:hypothetical protein n=1 Tax=Bradyrhizobium sp. BR13661 TaxID=2940622 RepID=UPI0024758182|nr:hypothetical protein [Bradyrhizobium sp. BR13661]MDH6258412.1 hypothetical protein [Bradyrhizobium sp. BR13661]